jgi:hypothetical protein
MRRVIIFATGLVIAILAACDNYTIPNNCEDGATGVSYSGDVQPIFNSNCISCHPGAHPLDLREDWSYDELIDGGYVAEPEAACESILIQVLLGSSHDGRADSIQISQILGWIQEGAQDN